MKKEDFLKKNNSGEFSRKYTETNFITRKLIENFYLAIKNIAPKDDVKKVLEVGCGHGFSTKYIREIFRGATVEASDYQDYLIEDAKINNPDINISKESIYELNRLKDSFNLVLSLEVMEHLEDPERALEEIERVTNNYCILSVPNEPLWRFLNVLRGKYLKNFGNTEGHINHWSKKSFIKFVEKHFDVVDVKTPLPWIVILAKKRK